MEELVDRTLQLKMREDEDWESLPMEPVEITGLSLLGSLLTKKPWTKKLTKTVLGRIWGVEIGWDLKIIKQENKACILGFYFTDRDLLEMVLESRPWRLNDGVLFIDRWPNSGDWMDANLSSFSCWVTAFGIPLHLFTEKNIRKIAGYAGEVEEIQFDNAQNAHWRNFIRFKATIQSDNSISPGRFVPGNGRQIWVHFKCERLSIMCYKCGLIGHDKFLCNASQEVVKDSEGKNIPLFGPWIQSECNITNCFEGAKVGEGKPLKSNGAFEKYKARKMKERAEVPGMLLQEISLGRSVSGQEDSMGSDSRRCLAPPRSADIAANITPAILQNSNLVDTDTADNTETSKSSKMVGVDTDGSLLVSSPTASATVPSHTNDKSLVSSLPRDK
ncbi:hypothetical protein UlMin_009704 [Ulmus minor]